MGILFGSSIDIDKKDTQTCQSCCKEFCSHPTIGKRVVAQQPSMRRKLTQHLVILVCILSHLHQKGNLCRKTSKIILLLMKTLWKNELSFKSNFIKYHEY